MNPCMQCLTWTVLLHTYVKDISFKFRSVSAFEVQQRIYISKLLYTFSISGTPMNAV